MWMQGVLARYLNPILRIEAGPARCQKAHFRTVNELILSAKARRVGKHGFSARSVELPVVNGRHDP